MYLLLKLISVKFNFFFIYNSLMGSQIGIFSDDNNTKKNVHCYDIKNSKKINYN